MPDFSAVPQIRAVLFDFGMVLSGPPEPSAWARMLATAALPEDRLHAGYWAHRHAYDRGALTGEAYWHAVAQHAGTAFEDAQVQVLLGADVDLWTDLNLPMVEWAARLQRAGIRTGILSNIGDAIAEGICARLPWLAAFDHCTWSHELKMAKPELEIYTRTAQALHTDPAHILFVDDRSENIAAAEAAGMQAILYTSHPEFEAAMSDRGLDWLLNPGAAPADPALASSRPSH